MAATQKRRKRGRRDGRGERRVSALPKKWKGCVHQAMSEQEEHEGVKRGATGGQRAGGKQVWRASCTGELQANCETERGRGDERKQCVVQKGSGRTTSYNATTPHVRDGQMRTRGGWAMGSEEGERGRESRQDRPFWGDKRVVTHTHRRSRSRMFPRSPTRPSHHPTSLSRGG